MLVYTVLPLNYKLTKHEAKSKKLVKPKAPARRGVQAATVDDQTTESTPTQRAAGSERQTREEDGGNREASVESFVAPVVSMSRSTTETRRRGLRSQERGDSSITVTGVDVQHDSDSSTRTRSGRKGGNNTTLPSINLEPAVTRDPEQTPIETVPVPDVTETVTPLTPPASQVAAGGFIKKSKKAIAPKAPTRRQRAISERTQSADHSNATGETVDGATSTTPIVIDQQADADNVAYRLLAALANYEHQSSSANIDSSSNQATAPSGSAHAMDQPVLQSNGASGNGEIAVGSVTETVSTRTQRPSRKRKKPTIDAENGQETIQSAKSKRARTKKSASTPKSANPTTDTATHPLNETNGDETQQMPQNPKGRKRKRVGTPEDALTREIEPTEIRMDELTVDIHQGQISQREQRLRQRDVEIKERKLQAAQGLAREELQEIMTEGAPNNQPNLTTTEPSPDLPTRSPSPDMVVSGPQFRIVNGQIVTDESSRIIDRRAQRTRAAEASDEDASALVEDDLSRRVNSRSHTKYDNPTRWSPAATELFYKGLQYFGLEFSMMACLFPSRSRRQLKAKFIREERADVGLVNALLKDRQPIPSREELEAMMGKKLKDPKELDEELRIQKEELEEAQRAEDAIANERRLAREREAEEEGRRIKDRDEGIEEEDEEDEEEQKEEEERSSIVQDDASVQEQEEEQEVDEETEDDDNDDEE